MSAASGVAAIKARLLANWTSTPIAWPREEFAEPRDGAGQPLPFVSFLPEEVDAQRLGIGAVYDRSGRVLLNVLMPVGRGEEAAQALRTALTAIFADGYFSGVRTEIEEDNADCGTDDSGNYSVSYVAIRWQEWAGA